ncbi:hypothetical protein SERLA73DRAFT_149201 [Serpula lacrymans var. lacrymans S7.3]|uniref:Uncharacterized protein n=1 Tax=Serpula lacrymans var. lacrymans (strain S7.3) TaxID=936435 RepID=F8PGE2_SERL3|nr:hypothetical protein SERLA73DRAFT_149201 [Serpula lacrymans var. lacrymans S7.3]
MQSGHLPPAQSSFSLRLETDRVNRGAQANLQEQRIQAQLNTERQQPSLTVNKFHWYSKLVSEHLKYHNINGALTGTDSKSSQQDTNFASVTTPTRYSLGALEHNENNTQKKRKRWDWLPIW